MCGFAGFLDRDYVLPGHQHAGIVARMAAMLEKRGPDDSGVWCRAGEGLALGFRRLAIRDLSRLGHQPMVSERFGSALVFNGEIYNADELRRSLEARGEAFQGHSDTEVLQRCLDIDGIDTTLPRLTGMFAIAYWQDEGRSLTLIRDRFGIKPLFYAQIQRGLVLFASQLSALRPYPLFQPEICNDSLHEYLQFGYVPAPATIFRDVRNVRPGSWVRLNTEGERHHHQWWNSVEELPKARDRAWGLSDEDRMEQLHDAIHASVRDRLVADVPVGCFLSGGIDSSLTTAIIQQHATRPVKSYCIGFAEGDFDESRHARAIAAHLGTDHHERLLTSKDMLDEVPRLAAWCDEPFADFSLIPTMLVSRLARSDVTVALSGDGGDELCAGYVRHHAVQNWLKAAGYCPKVAAKPLASLLSTAAQLMNGLSTGPVTAQRLRKLADILLLPKFSTVFRHHVQYWERPDQMLGRSGMPSTGIWSDILAEEFRHPLDHGRMIDILTYLPDDILTKVDRASMSVSLEARVPLLDQRVARAAWALPSDTMIADGRGKWPLRHLLKRYLPEELFNRPKKGFSIPVAAWLRGDLRDWAHDLLQPSSLQSAGIAEHAIVRTTLDQHTSGKADHGRKLWNILMYVSWHQHWMTGSAFGKNSPVELRARSDDESRLHMT